LDIFVDVEPLRMVVHFFGNQRRARHKAESLIEILEHEFPGDGVAARYFRPAGQFAERGLAGAAAQFCSHGPTSFIRRVEESTYPIALAASAIPAAAMERRARAFPPPPAMPQRR